MTDKLFYKATTGILFLSLSLTSCGSLIQSPTDYGNTPAERRLREESKLFNSSSLEACLLLGGLTGIIFYAANRDPNQALIAAAAGCGIGVGANYYVQTRRSQYRNNEQRLRSMIADLRTDNARLRRLIAASKEVIGADLRKIAAIDKAYREKRISLARARAEMRSVNKNQAHFSRTLSNLKERERRWLRVAQDERRYNPRSRGIAVMDREINTLQSQIAVMEQELDILAQRRIVSPAG
jgi:hypothetical protein